MLELLFDFSLFSFFFDFKDDVEAIDNSLMPKLLEPADDDDDVVETEAPEDAETDVRTLLDFLRETADDGQRGFSRHSSGLSDEKSARIPLSVTRDIQHN